MSHFTVLVIGDDPEKQLAPYQENNMENCPEKSLTFHADEDSNIDKKTGKRGYWTNENAKWDWYELGGRWTGFFKARNGAQTLTGRPGLMTEPANPGYADQLLKADIDFDAMYSEAADKAAKEYDTVMAVIGHLPVNKTWKEVLGSRQGTDVENARKEYAAQPRVAAYREAADKGIREYAKAKNKGTVNENEPMYFHLMGTPDEYIVSRDEYIGRAMRNTIIPYALVKDGKWYERGKMGWWGMSINEKDPEEWSKQVYKLLEEAPADTLLSLFDCHI